MGIINRVRESFSTAMTTARSGGGTRNALDINSNMSVGGIGSATAVSSDLGNFITGMSNFPQLSEHQIYEQFYIWEPEIAATINKTAAMVRSSFNYFTLIDDAELDNLPPTSDISEGLEVQNPESGSLDLLSEDEFGNSTIVASKAIRDEMCDTANEIARTINIPNLFEVLAAIMYTHGEVFLRKYPDKSLEILPNDRVTILDDLGRIHNTGDITKLVTQENYLVFDEQLPTELKLKRNEFIHIKLYDVPLTLKDNRGRTTFGIYSISPLQRCIIPIWMKRQIYITETLWRWANVPREHHTIEAEAYKLNLYPGTPEMKKAAAEKAMSSDIAKWSAQLKSDAPDQKYVTSSNIKITPVEHSGSSYMESNGLLEQIQDAIWDGVGMPRSVIKGKSDGSYASDLVVSSGASLFVEQIANKIGRVMLDNVRERLLIINKQYPVNQLDIKITFKIAPNRLEQMRNMQLMKDVGQFTSTEIREEVGKPSLTKDQIDNEGVVTSGNVTIVKGTKDYENQGKMNQNTMNPMTSPKNKLRPTNSGNGVKSDGSVNTPTTPHSANTQDTDSSKAVTDTVMYRDSN